MKTSKAFFHRHRYWLWKILFSLNVGIGISYFALWFVAAQQDLQWRADFTANYTGATLVRNGFGNRLYDFEVQRHYQQQILLKEEKIADELLPYISPPHLAFILVPFTYFKLSTAFAIWSLGTVVCIIWIIRIMQGLTPDWPPIERHLLISVFLAFPPLLQTILLGTTSLFVLGSMFQIYQTLRDNRPLGAGIWLALGTLRPQAIFPLALMALLQHRLRMLFGALLMGCLIVVITSFSSGGQVWLDFITSLWRTGQYFNQFGVNPAVMYNLKGTLTLWLGSEYASLINLISFGGLIFAISAMIWLWHDTGPACSPAFDLKLALALLMGLFFTTHLNRHDGLLMLLPLFLFVNYLYRTGLPTETVISLLGGLPIFILVADFILQDILPVRGPVLIMLGLIIWTGYTLNRASRAVLHQQCKDSVDPLNTA